MGFHPDVKIMLQLLLKVNFEFDEKTGVIIICPKGKNPMHLVNKKGQVVAHFEKAVCDNCQFRDKCRVKQQKKSYVVRISHKAITAAKQRALIQKNLKENTSKGRPLKAHTQLLKEVMVWQSSKSVACTSAVWYPDYNISR